MAANINGTVIEFRLRPRSNLLGGRPEEVVVDGKKLYNRTREAGVEKIVIGSSTPRSNASSPSADAAPEPASNQDFFIFIVIQGAFAVDTITDIEQMIRNPDIVESRIRTESMFIGGVAEFPGIEQARGDDLGSTTVRL